MLHIYDSGLSADLDAQKDIVLENTLVEEKAKTTCKHASKRLIVKGTFNWQTRKNVIKRLKRAVCRPCTTHCHAMSTRENRFNHRPFALNANHLWLNSKITNYTEICILFTRFYITYYVFIIIIHTHILDTERRLDARIFKIKTGFS